MIRQQRQHVIFELTGCVWLVMQWESASKACSALKLWEGLTLLGLPEVYEAVILSAKEPVLFPVDYAESLPESIREVCSTFWLKCMLCGAGHILVSKVEAGFCLCNCIMQLLAKPLVCKNSMHAAQHKSSWRNDRIVWIQVIPRSDASRPATIDDLFNHFAADLYLRQRLFDPVESLMEYTRRQRISPLLQCVASLIPDVAVIADAEVKGQLSHGTVDYLLDHVGVSMICVEVRLSDLGDAVSISSLCNPHRSLK